jgi:hypothetical protein
VERFVVLKEGDVQWIATDSTKPIVTIKDCVLEKENEEFFRCMFEVCGDNALIQSKTQAIVVNCTNGVIWRGSELDSVSLQGQRILAQYSDGSVEVIRSSGTIETKQLPLYGYRTIAMDTIEDTLKIAYYCDSRYAFEIRTFNLGDR